MSNPLQTVPVGQHAPFTKEFSEHRTDASEGHVVAARGHPPANARRASV